MKKPDLKKLALLGITGGIALTSTSVEANVSGTESYLALGSCGSSTDQTYSGSYYGGTSYTPSQTYPGVPAGSYAPSGAMNGCQGRMIYDNQPYQGQTSQNYYYNQNPPAVNPQFQNQPMQNPNLPQNQTFDRTQGYRGQANSYIADTGAPTTMTPSTQSRDEFLRGLSDDEKSLFNRLSPEAQNWAIQNKDKFSTRREAIKAAAAKIAERRSQMAPGTGTSGSQSSGY